MEVWRETFTAGRSRLVPDDSAECTNLEHLILRTTFLEEQGWKIYLKYLDADKMGAKVVKSELDTFNGP